MNWLALDISGKVDNYDHALYESIANDLSSCDKFVFACPYFSINKQTPSLRLLSFIPTKYKQSSNILKRIYKALEGIVNYLITIRYIKKNPIDVIHLQWLPFLEVCGWERYWLKSVLKIRPNCKIILTAHNIYPHNSSNRQKELYKKRMQKIDLYIDAYIVHNNASKDSLAKEFCIALEKVNIVHHGIFIPTSRPKEQLHPSSKVRFLLFGSQSAYKGTDILINAIGMLPQEQRKNIEVHIVGHTDKEFYNKYSTLANELHINWLNQYVEDISLYQEIQSAHVLIYPYRAIAQSGALLLGIYFRKTIILSDLPSFKETMGTNYPPSLFFSTGNAKELMLTIQEYLTNTSKYSQTIIPILENIIKDNDWESAAKKTIELYQKINTGSGRKQIV